MKATIMGVTVRVQFFVVLTFIIIAIELYLVRAAQRKGLISKAHKTVVWTTDRIVACGAMAIVSVAALLGAFFAFVTSFVESWEVLWLCAAVLLIAGLAGLIASGRLLEASK